MFDLVRFIYNSTYIVCVCVLECWTVKNKHKNQVSATEMRMLRMMSDKIRRDMIKNDTIKES